MSRMGKPSKFWKLGKYTFPFYRGQLDTVCQNKIKEHNTILDAGCGHNTTSFSCIPTNVTAVLLDINKKNVQTSKQNCKKNCQKQTHHMVADITHLPFRNNIFDLILSQDVIEHVTNNLHAIKEAHRACKHGGIFTGTTTNLLNPIFFLDSFAPKVIMSLLTNKFAGQDHYERHTRPTVKALAKAMKKSGFKTIAINLTGYPLFKAWEYQNQQKPKLPIYAYLWIAFDKVTNFSLLKQLKEAIIFQATKT